MGDILSLMGYVQQQGEQGRARGLSQLLGKAYNAPPDQRQAVLGQVANVDGGMAMDAQKAFGQQDEAVHDQIIKRAAMVASLYKANPQMAQAAYQGLPELAQRGGFGQVPAQLDDKVAAALEQMVAAARQSGTGGNVQSTYIDDKGQRVAIMRDGSVQVLGANAPNNQIIDTGNGFFGVNKSNLQAAPVMTGGAAPQQGPQRAPGEVPFSIDPSLPPEVQASIRGNEAQWAQAPDGGEIGIGGGGGAPQGAPMGGQLRSAPKAPATPAGYRPTADGSGLEMIPGGPAQVAADARAQAAAAKQAAEAAKAAAEQAKADQKRQVATARQAEASGAATQLVDAIDGLMASPGFKHLGTVMGDLEVNVPMIRNDAKDANAQLHNIAGQVALTTMARLKALSAQGATGFGALSAPELKLLQNSISTLQSDQISNKQLVDSLANIKRLMQKTATWKGGDQPSQAAPAANDDVRRRALLDKY